MTDEVRVVDPKTGGEKGSKLARFDLIPPGPLHTLAEHYGVGARKYEDRNWEKGYDWGLSFAALNRHLWAFWNGEYVDEETGMPHLAAVVFHAFALMHFHDENIGTDSRPVREKPERPFTNLLNEKLDAAERQALADWREAIDRDFFGRHWPQYASGDVDHVEYHSEWIDHGGEG